MQQPPNADAIPVGSNAPSGPSGPLPTAATGSSPDTHTQAATGAGATAGTPLWSPPHTPSGPGSSPDDATTAFTTTANASSTGGATPPPIADVIPPSGAGTGGGKRLYRKTQDKLFLGVCSGLAEYFGIDKTLMRIIFICGSLLVGTGLILYLVLALVMPAEESLDLDPRIAAQQTVEEAVNEVKRGAEYVTTKARDLTNRNKPQT